MFEPQNKPASAAELKELDRLTEGRLPREYLDILSVSNGLESDLPIMPYGVILDTAKVVIDGINGSGYEVPSGLITIGTSGGGELIVLDMRKEPPWVASIPAVCGDLEDLYLLAHSFSDFISMIGKKPDPKILQATDELFKRIPLCVSLNAQFWTADELPIKVKELELDKYAPEYDPIAELPGSDFIGVKRDDGTVWRVPCLGTKFLQAHKMAESLDQLKEFLTELEEHHKIDAWRYYEQTERD